MSGVLSLERAAATAAFRGVGVLESETLLFEAFVPIDRGSVEVQRTLFVHDDCDTMAFVFAVHFVVEAVVEVQRVAESAAATGRDADSQHHLFAEIMFLLVPLDFFGGSFA